MKKWLALFVAASIAAGLFCSAETADFSAEQTSSAESSQVTTPAPATDSGAVKDVSHVSESTGAGKRSVDNPSASSDVPSSTNAPTSTDTPAPTNTPASTDTPAPANTPASTDAPSPTDTPASTDAPSPTNTPASTDAPSTTDAPASTDVPSPTNTPASTDAPSPTNPSSSTDPGKDPGENAVIGPESSTADILKVQELLIQLAYLEDNENTGIYDETTLQAVKQFQTDMNSQGHTLKVSGLCDTSTLTLLEQKVAEASGTQPPKDDNPGGFPGGGFSSGGRPGGTYPGGFSGAVGGMAGGDMAEQNPYADTDGVEPGKAITSSHSNGNKDTSLYGAVSLEISSESTSSLILGNVPLNVSLFTVFESEIEMTKASFTPELSADGTVLSLTTTDAAYLEWSIDGLALRALNRSGVTMLALTGGGKSVCLPTASLLSGSAYEALRSKGYTDNTLSFSIVLNNGVVTISVTGNSETYIASESEDAPMRLNGVIISDQNSAEDT